MVVTNTAICSHVKTNGQSFYLFTLNKIIELRPKNTSELVTKKVGQKFSSTHTHVHCSPTNLI